MLLAGHKQKEIARRFQVSESAISHAKRALKKQVVRQASFEKADAVVETHLDMIGQLRRINQAINEELDRAKEELATDAKNKHTIQKIIIELSAEIRKQLDAQLRIAEVWHDQKVYAEFQAEVLNILNEMEPGSRERVLKALRQRRAIRRSVSIG
jgi:hypothetical protein